MYRRIFAALFMIIFSLSTLVSVSFAGEELPYAYVVHVTSDNWVDSYCFINSLLYAGVPVYWAQSDFKAGNLNFDSGDFIIPITAPCIGWKTLPPAKANNIVSLTANMFPEISLSKVEVEFNADVLVLKPCRVAIYGDQISNCFVFYGLIKSLGFKADIVTGMEIRAGVLENYDVLVLPGDSLPQLYSLGEEGCNEVKRFITRGGGLIASCAGTVATAGEAPGEVWPQKKFLEVGRWYMWNVNTSEPFLTFPGYYNPPGIGLITLKNENPNHPVMLGIPETFTIVHWQGPILKPVPVGYIMWPKINLTAKTVEWEEQWLSNPIPLASYYSWTENFTFFEYYYNLTGQKVASADELKNTWLGRGISEGLISIIAGYMGNGKVVVAGSHPELGLRLSLEFRGSVDIQSKIFANAILWEVSEPSFNPVSFPIEYGFQKLISMKDKVNSLFNELRELSPTAPSQLVLQSYSTFGMSPEEKWAWLLEDIPKSFDKLSVACDEALKTLAMLQDMLRKLHSIEERLLKLRERGFNVNGELELITELEEELLSAIKDFNEAINFIYPEEWTPPDANPPRFYAGAAVKMGAIQILDLATKRLEVVISALKGEVEWPSYIWGVDALLGGYGLDGFLLRCVALIAGNNIEARSILSKIDFKIGEIEEFVSKLEELPTTTEVMEDLSELRTEIEKIVEARISATMSTVYSLIAIVGVIGSFIGAVIGYMMTRKIKP